MYQLSIKLGQPRLPRIIEDQHGVYHGEVKYVCFVCASDAASAMDEGIHSGHAGDVTITEASNLVQAPSSTLHLHAQLFHALLPPFRLSPHTSTPANPPRCRSSPVLVSAALLLALCARCALNRRRCTIASLRAQQSSTRASLPLPLLLSAHSRHLSQGGVSCRILRTHCLRRAKTQSARRCPQISRRANTISVRMRGWRSCSTG